MSVRKMSRARRQWLLAALQGRLCPCNSAEAYAGGWCLGCYGKRYRESVNDDFRAGRYPRAWKGWPT